MTERLQGRQLRRHSTDAPVASVIRWPVPRHREAFFELPGNIPAKIPSSGYPTTVGTHIP